MDSQGNVRELRSLTDKGQAQFDTLYKARHDKYDASRAKLLQYIARLAVLDLTSVDKQELHSFNTELSTLYENFYELGNELSLFLSRAKTEDGDKINHNILAEMDKAKSSYDSSVVRILDITQKLCKVEQGAHSRSEMSDNLSRSSLSSKSSSRSLSSIQAQKRAKAEAAMAKLAFTTQETELRIQQAILTEQEQLNIAASARKKAVIEAELKLLSDKKDIAEAVAEADALDRIAGEDSDKHSVWNSISVGSQNSLEHVRQYVKDLNVSNPCNHPEVNLPVSAPHINVSQQTEPDTVQSYSKRETLDLPQTSQLHSSPPMYNTQSSASAILKDSCVPHNSVPLPINSPKPTLPERNNVLNLSQDLPHVTSDTASLTLNPHAQTFVPTASKHVDSSVASEIGQFFIKKELLISRLHEFNDKPETYDAWKSSFKRLVTDLKLTSLDQLELLGKWLGPTSKKYAESVRNSNMGDPDRGIQLLWERLDNCYGTPEQIEASLLRRLNEFEPITHNNTKRYYDFADLLSEIESLQRNERYRAQLSVFNSSSGVTPVAKKILPYNVYEKWITRASNYKLAHSVVFPPFSEFVSFVKDMCRIRNDPSFTFQPPTTCNPASGPKSRPQSQRTSVKQDLFVKSTSFSKLDSKTLDVCPIHSTNHTLNECRTFRSKPIFVRRKFLKDNGICFGCCLSKDHNKANCPSRAKCNECKEENHPTALHIKFKPKDNGGESSGTTSVKQVDTNPAVSSKCTEVCGDSFKGKSCSKIVLVRVYYKDSPNNRLLTYAILDEQSNQSLAKSQLFTSLNIDGPEIEYTLNSCSGLTSSSGHIANDCVIESYDGSVQLDLPSIIECDNIPANREEIPTPNVASSYPHLQDIRPFIPPLQNVPILILIGRDLGIAHHVLDQRLSQSQGLPYAQKLHLGWVIIGESCLGKLHTPSVIANKTHILAHGRPTTFQPCESTLHLKEKEIGANVFAKTANDNVVGMSVEDKEFIHIMHNAFEKSESGHWQAPLPFRSDRQILPNNRSYTLRRAINLHNSLVKNAQKREDMVAFIGKMFERCHAEVAPPLTEGQECWYLPVFGVYHPRKPGQIRAVFDSSASYSGVSLNSVLLSGPDLNNSLLAVLLQFRKDAIAVTADIEQMFHSFMVKEEHRNFLRFFWYKSNDPTKQLIEYRMKVHLFGNSPSPAVACYGLRKTADNSEQQYGSDVKSFIYNHFYVDDGLISLPTSAEVIDLISRSQSALMEVGKLRLHKFASNSPEVMQAFSQEDLSKDLKDFDFDNDCLPAQRSLGLVWSLQSDSFTFRVTDANKPYTRRGILSVINSLYDPLGIASPVVIAGKLFLRKVTSDNAKWDDPLPDDLEPVWNEWKSSLSILETVSVPRCFTEGTISFESANKDLLLFSDASEDAIAAVAYIRSTSSQETTTNFVIGKAKVAPSHGHSLPRLELCAAVLSVELYDIIINALNDQFSSVCFHTDSKVVLGYINNRTRRFYMYVSNRVERIHQSSTPQQWKYVSSEHNPADCATRALSATHLRESLWLRGPTYRDTESMSDFPLIDSNNDKELKPDVTVLATNAAKEVSLPPIHERFSNFSDWNSLKKAVSCLLHIASTFSGKDSNCHGWHYCKSIKRPENIHAAEVTILRLVQKHAFPDVIESLQSGKPLPQNCILRALDPYLDKDKLIRVGGRLRNSDLPVNEKFPVILPKNHHISQLLIRYYHERVHHQGRHITQGALRSAGFWIIGEKRLVSSAIHHCVTCKKLRGRVSVQKMSDLPDDRLSPSPPFSYVGVDVFGPWNIVYRRTRGSCVNTKRWAVLFTCLVVRAIHIEVIEDMSSSCFINALRRFICVRGPVKEIRSDRGSNFIGAVEDLKANVINVEDTSVASFLNSESVVWKFNPPHSSHMGGVWERMIGVSRRILDSLLSGVSGNSLTHEILVTFMCEVMAIVNARPIVPVSSDPNNPCVLSPSVLLTQKTGADIAPFQDIDQSVMYKAQWKRVQCLAESFWKRWSSEFLQTLQKRAKWQDDQLNINDGDVVLVKQSDLHRNDWPMATVVKAIRSDDGRVRKAEVRVTKDGTSRTYTRPISELVFLVPRTSD